MYRKLSANFIFNGYDMLQHQVLITDVNGVVEDLVSETVAGDDVEKLDGILCPGFINAHCHLELSHMKGLIPKHTGLVDFVIKVVNERHVDEAVILNSIEMAENELLQNGIVAVGDICNNILTIPQKSKGRLQYHNFIETTGFVPALAQDRFNKALAFLEKFQTNNKHRSSISPHAPYSVSANLFGLINTMPNNPLITIHNQEIGAENEFLEKGAGDFLRLYQQMGIDISFFTPSGKTSLQTWLPHFTNEQSIILVHNVATTQSDLALLHQSNFLCLCPNANLYISNIVPDVNMLMAYTDNIVLGTDSLASNDQLSILHEIKILQHHFPELNLEILLKWATSNGARALQLEDSLGSFEKGKQPGILLIAGINNMTVQEQTFVKRIL